MDPLFAALDRLRSFCVAGFGFALALAFWVTLQDHLAPTEPFPQVADARWVAVWRLIWLAVLVWGVRRYAWQPVLAVLGACGPAQGWQVILRLVSICMPYCWLCAAVLASFGLDLVAPVSFLPFLALIFGWDWMKARSNDAVRALSEAARAIPDPAGI